jgi:hypothetical protein
MVESKIDEQQKVIESLRKQVDAIDALSKEQVQADPLRLVQEKMY